MTHDARRVEQSPRRPVPVSTADTRPFWTAAAAAELRLPRCARCAVLFYPPPPRCPRCGTKQLAWTKLSGRGRIIGLTAVHLPTIPGMAPPFTVVEVELEEQAGLIVSAVMVADEPVLPVVGDLVAIEFTPPDANAIAYPQVRVTAGGAA